MQRILLFIVLPVLAVLAVGCGGAAANELVAPAPVTLNFKGQDIAYDMTEATVQSGSQVTVNFQNAGALEHSWVLVSPGTDVSTATEADALAGATTGSIVGGQSKAITFTAPPAGDYTYVCTVPGHAAAGMVGTLKVTS